MVKIYILHYITRNKHVFITCKYAIFRLIYEIYGKKMIILVFYLKIKCNYII